MPDFTFLIFFYGIIMVAAFGSTFLIKRVLNDYIKRKHQEQENAWNEREARWRELDKKWKNKGT